MAAELCEPIGYRFPPLPQAEDDIDGDYIETIATQIPTALKLESQDLILNLASPMERRGIVVAVNS
ncbi:MULTISPECIES: hypothetical protein [unclassified Arthrobacter]|uniref:hypothetical protein n=1 Tax=unclassified Arthrobacter TaxID=235627 RepID=UPI002E0A051D|nr:MULTISPECIES: hypothetical protein [unclassified Arthrobacter]MEC5193033.1 hypothetical protein [Arthrobacter sp. MP_M4]MEC5204562.1 hypothetical protein [Arthrobacter sp. MP_M7]